MATNQLINSSWSLPEHLYLSNTNRHEALRMASTAAMLCMAVSSGEHTPAPLPLHPLITVAAAARIGGEIGRSTASHLSLLPPATNIEAKQIQLCQNYYDIIIFNPDVASKMSMLILHPHTK